MLHITCFWNEEIEDSRFQYAVIAAAYGEDWIFVRQAVRQTYELPAGRRESGESILQTAHRELYEETGAVRYTLQPICAFMVSDDSVPAAPDAPCGMLYLAQVRQLASLPAESEIGEIILTDKMPQPLSYPEVQPGLFALARSFSRKFEA